MGVKEGKHFGELTLDILGPHEADTSANQQSTTVDNQSSTNQQTAAEKKAKGNYNPDTYTDTSISEVPNDPRTSAINKQAETNAMYSDEDAAKDLATHANRQNQIVDNFALTPEQWYKMYGYWDWNLARNNPNGNLNNRTFGRTLALSRVADALNNQRHWRAAKIGRRTNSGFGTNEYQEGHSERWEPVETQETRQMRANERLDELTRQRQINRSENIQDYPLELQKQSDRLNQELTKYASQTGIDLQRTMQAGKWQAEYGNSWQTYWSNFMTKFSRELDLDIRDRVMQKIARLGYPFSQIYASLSGGMAPNPLITTAYQYINEAMAGETDSKAKAAIAMAAMSSLSGMLGAQVFNTARAGFGNWLGLTTSVTEN